LLERVREDNHQEISVGCGLQPWRTRLIDLIGRRRRRKSIRAVRKVIL